MTLPPVGSITWPVMKLAPGPARKTATAATSSGWPTRARGICASFARHSADMAAGPSMSVSIGPGAMALIRMSGPNSLAQARVSVRTPALEAQ
jgi:hypothetical protein